jgi:hypothetical protein
MLLCETQEPEHEMISEKTQATEKRGRNSEAYDRCGCIRSSDEVAVMAMERRGAVIRYFMIEQLIIQEDFIVKYSLNG